MLKDPKSQNKPDPKIIQELKEQVGDYKNKYLRALADYQNFEKRISEEKTELKKRANKELILKLLPFLDNLDKAEVFIKDGGLKIIKESYIKLLKEEGLKELDVLGKEFDPHTCEVVDVIEGKQDNIVVEVLRKGYEFQGKILRVAQVKVSKSSSQMRGSNKQ